ncbi:MAG: hypothetical protein H6727_01355 [Myxococcales bacterium]|nr:hypothetical protein [Myxococcales bacterium]
MTSKLQETMQVVMQAQEIQNQFYKNISDLFRLLEVELEEQDPGYTAILERGALWTSSVSQHLRDSKTWQVKHLAFPMRPTEGDGPLLLLHVSTDAQFSKEPELWLGLFHNLSPADREKYPYPDTLEYIFRDYFGPEEEWQDLGTWYQTQIEDEHVEVRLDFCRLSLASLEDVLDVREQVCARIRRQCEAHA